MATDLSQHIAPVPIEASASKSSSLGGKLLTAAVLVWFAILILVPTGALAARVVSAGWSSFATTMAQPEVQRAFALSFGITAVATILNTLFGVAFAIVLARHRFPGRSFLDGLVDLPFAVSPIVAGLMLIALYGPEGWFGRPLEAAGFRVVYALPGMILATSFVTLPFVVRELVPVLQALGDEQELAAYTLGANRWTTFWRITLPSIRWGLAYGITLTIARSLGEFGALLVVSGNLLGRTQTATLYVHDGIESFRPDGAYSVSFVLAALSFILLVGIDYARARVAAREGS